jgi:hypothetical protein
MIFVVFLSDGPVDVAELVEQPVFLTWRQLALLWKSQLAQEDGKRLWQAFRVVWRFPDKADPVLEIRTEDGSPVPLWPSIPWPPDRLPDPPPRRPTFGLEADPDSDVGRSLRQSAFMQTAVDNRELLYALVPYWRAFPEEEVGSTPGLPVTNAHLLLEVLLAETTPDNLDERLSLYEFAEFGTEGDFRERVLERMATDLESLPADALKDVRQRLWALRDDGRSALARQPPPRE